MSSLRDGEEFGALVLGLAYLAMAVMVPRHVLLYRHLAAWAGDAGGRGLRRALLALGWTKRIYEMLWLGCCGNVLVGVGTDGGPWLTGFALAALFGCGGFAAIWIWMMIAHAQLIGVTRHAAWAGPGVQTACPVVSV